MDAKPFVIGRERLSERLEQGVRSWASEQDCVASILILPHSSQMTLVRVWDISMPQFCRCTMKVLIVPASLDFPEG